MKLYVHYEDRTGLEASPSLPPRLWTKRITLTPALQTLDDVLRVFCAAHARKFANGDGDKETATLILADLDVFTERGQESATRKRFEDDRRAQKWITQRQWTTGKRDGDDGECAFELIVVRKTVAGTSAQTSSSITASSDCVPSAACTVKTQRSKIGDSNQTKEKHSTPPPPHKQQQLKAFVELGVSQMQLLKYRSAKQLYETLVLSVDPSNAQALIAMGDIHFANQRFDVAVNEWYRKCWDAHSDKPSQGKEHSKAVFECGLKIVRCEIQRKKYREALQMIDKLQEVLRHGAKSSKSNSGSVVVTPSITTEKEEMEAKMDLLKAQAIYEMHTRSPELQEPAIALLVHLLPDLQDPRVNLDALLLYARIAFERGKKSEALTMVLRVLVARSDDKLVKQQLASFLTGKSDMKLLQQVLPAEGGASSAAAYAFIGTILKDFGELESSVTCFERAQVGNSACPSYALNHAHVLEVCNRYETAYNVLTSFFRRKPTLSVGGVLTAGTILKALDADGWVSAADQSDQGVHDDEKEADKREQWRVEWIMKDTGHARVYLNDILVASPKGGSSKSSLVPEQEQLDLLACFFTVVKILFLTGRVSGLPRLISLIEPVRTGKELHRTAIRNEQAYYSCIAQLLSVDDRSPASGLHRRPFFSEVASTDVYVCGDSHTLATAWREIQIQGHSTLLRPALVTGLKHWHLRKESTFYPKLHFWRVLESIPRRAKVVFLFGEIDCREGILLAVERCKYESVEEGMEATIRIFMEALSEAVHKFEFEAFIHPVVPVLNETRQLVIQYNHIFQKHVLKSRICSWLDFFGDLVHDSAEKLRPEFALDGTHLHPRYLSSLERALN